MTSSLRRCYLSKRDNQPVPGLLLDVIAKAQEACSCFRPRRQLELLGHLSEDDMQFCALSGPRQILKKAGSRLESSVLLFLFQCPQGVLWVRWVGLSVSVPSVSRD